MSKQDGPKFDGPQERVLREWLRAGLQKPGKKRKGLAHAMGCSEAGVSRLMAGKRRIQLEELPAIAKYLGEDVPAASIRREAPDAVTADDPHFSPEFFRLLGQAHHSYREADGFDLDSADPESLSQYARRRREEAIDCSALVSYIAAHERDLLDWFRDRDA